MQLDLDLIVLGQKDSDKTRFFRDRVFFSPPPFFSHHHHHHKMDPIIPRKRKRGEYTLLTPSKRSRVDTLFKEGYSVRLIAKAEKTLKFIVYNAVKNFTTHYTHYKKKSPKRLNILNRRKKR